MSIISRRAARVFTISALVLAACGGQALRSTEIVDVSKSQAYADVVEKKPTPPPNLLAAYARRFQLQREVETWNATVTWNKTVLWNETVKRNIEAARVQAAKNAEALRQRNNWSGRSGTAVEHPAPVSAATPTTATITAVPPTNFGNLAGVVQCIKDHESGNYSESSHIYAGSGAFQFIPGTWRHYAGLAGYGQYAFAYQAPPAVQDAVLMYTLTHGGAHNWDNAFGNDPCTMGMP